MSDWDEADDDAHEFPGGGVFEPEAGLAVWVMAAKCATCIFHPGNRMHLSPGRVKEMVRAATADQRHITCHDTLLYSYTTRLRPAVCRGYFDHPQGNERSLALRTGRALRSFQYQQPTKEPSMLLAELVATTGLSMRLRRGEVRTHSTGFTGREWKITYAVDGRTHRTTFHLGNPDEDPDLLECLTHTLDVVRLVKGAASYEQWGQEQGGSDPAQWPPRTSYAQQVRETLRMEDFLGSDMLGLYLEAHGANTSEHQDQAPADLDALLPGHDVTRPVLEGVRWMVPDCQHAHALREEHMCTWRVLAVHQHRVRMAGLVRETQRGYQAVTWDADGRDLYHPEASFRQVAIATVARAYDPARHDAQ